MTSAFRTIVAGILTAVSLPALAAPPTAEALLPSADSRDAYTPCAAGGQGVFLVAWQSGRLADGDLRQGVKGASDIVALRVAASGKPLDAKPFVISAAAHAQQSPRVAHGGGVFLVVWQDFRNGKDWDVYAARVSPEGKVLDPEGIALCRQPRSQALPRVTWDGTAFQVVWQDYRSTERYEIYGGRVTPAGKVLDAAGSLLESAAGYHRYTPAVASPGGGKSFLLWCGDVRIGKGTITGGVFLADGKPAGTADTAEPKQGPGFEYVPICLAACPKGYLAAWTTDNTLGRDPRPGDTNATIFDLSGQRQRSFLLAGQPQRIRDPQAVWDGKDFIAVWHEAVPETKGGAVADAVFCSRISSAGQVSELTPLAGSFRGPAAQACVAADAGSSLIAYEKHPEKADTPIRIAVRLLAPK